MFAGMSGPAFLMVTVKATIYSQDSGGLVRMDMGLHVGGHAVILLRSLFTPLDLSTTYVHPKVMVSLGIHQALWPRWTAGSPTTLPLDMLLLPG